MENSEMFDAIKTVERVVARIVHSKELADIARKSPRVSVREVVKQARSAARESLPKEMKSDRRQLALSLATRMAAYNARLLNGEGIQNITRLP